MIARIYPAGPLRWRVDYDDPSMIGTTVYMCGSLRLIEWRVQRLLDRMEPESRDPSAVVTHR